MELDILGRKVVVEKAPQEQVPDACGYFHHTQGRIVVRDDLPPDMEAQVLLHELLHFVGDHLLSEPMQEEVIRALAAGLFAVIVQNKLDFAALAETGIRT